MIGLEQFKQFAQQLIDHEDKTGEDLGGRAYQRIAEEHPTIEAVRTWLIGIADIALLFHDEETAQDLEDMIYYIDYGIKRGVLCSI